MLSLVIVNVNDDGGRDLFDVATSNGDCLEHESCWIILGILVLALFNAATLNGDCLEDETCWITYWMGFRADK